MKASLSSLRMKKANITDLKMKKSVVRLKSADKRVELVYEQVEKLLRV